MELSQYQKEINQLYLFSRRSKDHLEYAQKNLVGEVGELLSLEAKYVRDHKNKDITLNYHGREVWPKIKKELGDILFMTVCLIDAYGLNAADVAEENLAKLKGRAERGTLGGSGDDR